MQKILENYLIIVIIGLFFVFALIGFVVDLIRKENTKTNDIDKSKDEIKPVNVTKIKEKPKDEDELLKKYNDNVKE